MLPVDIPETVLARINGVPLMECSYGMSNGRYALRVQKMINHQYLDSSKADEHE